MSIPSRFYEPRSLRIGETNPLTGSIRVDEDCFVSEWVVKRAPFRHRRARQTQDWVVVDKDDKLNEYAISDEAAAKKIADDLNVLATRALMVMP